MFGSISWLAYSIIKPDILVGASYTVTLASSLIVYAVKTRSKLFDNPVDDETDNIEDNGLSKMITIESDI